MWQGLQQLDRILRGEATRLPNLRGDGLQFPMRQLLSVLAVLAASYGICMGSYAVLQNEGVLTAAQFRQPLASLLKVPALFLLTLLVTFPSLYVFNALVGSQLRWGTMLRLLVAALAITVALLSSFGPIVAFFSVSTTSYPFMILLNVVVFAVSGMLGLMFLLQTLNRLSLITPQQPTIPLTTGDDDLPTPISLAATAAGPLDSATEGSLGRGVLFVFRIWLIVFGLVGAQMSWVLRPFIGNPHQPFTWFRPWESNFFEAVWNAIWSLFS